MKNEAIKKKFDDLAEEHGDSYKAVDVGSAVGLNARYHAIAREIRDRRYKTILDVGCAHGGLSEYFPRGYTGIDLSPKQIKVAKKIQIHNTAKFHVADVMDWPVSANLVVANGVLYLMDEVSSVRFLDRLWTLTETALMVTTVTNWGEQQEGEFRPSPSAILDWAHTKTDNIAMRTDHWKGDLLLTAYR